MRVNSTDTVCIVPEGKVSRATNGSKLSAVRPSEGVAKSVVVGERIADGVVGVSLQNNQVKIELTYSTEDTNSLSLISLSVFNMLTTLLISKIVYRL